MGSEVEQQNGQQSHRDGGIQEGQPGKAQQACCGGKQKDRSIETGKDEPQHHAQGQNPRNCLLKAQQGADDLRHELEEAHHGPTMPCHELQDGLPTDKGDAWNSDGKCNPKRYPGPESPQARGFGSGHGCSGPGHAFGRGRWRVYLQFCRRYGRRMERVPGNSDLLCGVLAGCPSPCAPRSWASRQRNLSLSIWRLHYENNPDRCFWRRVPSDDKCGPTRPREPRCALDTIGVRSPAVARIR